MITASGLRRCALRVGYAGLVAVAFFTTLVPSAEADTAKLDPGCNTNDLLPATGWYAELSQVLYMHANRGDLKPSERATAGQAEMNAHYADALRHFKACKATYGGTGCVYDDSISNPDDFKAKSSEVDRRAAYQHVIEAINGCIVSANAAVVAASASPSPAPSKCGRIYTASSIASIAAAMTGAFKAPPWQPTAIGGVASLLYLSGQNCSNKADTIPAPSIPSPPSK